MRPVISSRSQTPVQDPETRSKARKNTGEQAYLLGRDEAIVLGFDANGLIVHDVEDLECHDTVVHVNDSSLLDDLRDVLVVDVHVLTLNWSVTLKISGTG